MTQPMYEADQVRRALGIELLEAKGGTARMRMAVREDMINGHGLCHGGMLFTLADSACAYAANSRGPDSVAGGATIDYFEPARLGDVLEARAVELSRSGRRGVYDVTITSDDGATADGRVVASFRGITIELRQ
jgi:acyl-CoA thioesterase